jgi:circadian clock protein KaiC
MLLLTSAEDSTVLPEQTMVEGVIELSRRVPASQSLRYVEVKKFRSSDYLDGRHALQITPAGVVVYPRIESIYGESSDEEPLAGQRVGTGVARLDELLHGGLPAATTTLLLGPSGSGKTTFGLHFLSQSSEQERGLHFGFYETPKRLLNKATSLGLDLAGLQKKGLLSVDWEPPTERVLDRLGNRLIDAVRAQSIKRLFVDGLDALRLAAPGPERLSRFVAALTNELRTLGCSSMFSLELPELFAPEIRVPLDGISIVAENLMLLRYVEYGGSLRRLLAILKVRDSAFDRNLHEFAISAGGIAIAPDFLQADALLSGIAHARRGETMQQRDANGGET